MNLLVKSYWYVKGDYEYILSVAKLLFNSQKYLNFRKDSFKYSNKSNIYGAFLSDDVSNDAGGYYTYWIFTKLGKTEAQETYKRKGIRFEGLLNIKNGKLIKDTFYGDIEKYNL